AVSAEAPERAGDRADRVGGCGHLPDGVVVSIRDVHVAGFVERQAIRTVQAGLGRGIGVAKVAEIAGSRERGDGSVGIHFANAAIRSVPDVEVSSTVKDDPGGKL